MQKPRPVFPSFTYVLTGRLQKHIAWAGNRVRSELRDAFFRLQNSPQNWSMRTIDRDSHSELTVAGNQNQDIQNFYFENVGLRPVDDDELSDVSFLDLDAQDIEEEGSKWKRFLILLKTAFYKHFGICGTTEAV